MLYGEKGEVEFGELYKFVKETISKQRRVRRDIPIYSVYTAYIHDILLRIYRPVDSVSIRDERFVY